MNALRLCAASLAILTLASGLAGCGGNKEPDHSATAKGELLPRSVTDDMPPYDTVKSQPPLASPAPETDTATLGDSTAPASTPAPEDSAGAEATPTASPSPEPTASSPPAE